MITATAILYFKGNKTLMSSCVLCTPMKAVKGEKIWLNLMESTSIWATFFGSVYMSNAESLQVKRPSFQSDFTPDLTHVWLNSRMYACTGERYRSKPDTQHLKYQEWTEVWTIKQKEEHQNDHFSMQCLCSVGRTSLTVWSAHSNKIHLTTTHTYLSQRPCCHENSGRERAMLTQIYLWNSMTQTSTSFI